MIYSAGSGKTKDRSDRSMSGLRWHLGLAGGGRMAISRAVRPLCEMTIGESEENPPNPDLIHII